MSPSSRWCCGVIGAFVLSCGGAPLPDSYGIFVQTGRSLVQLRPGVEAQRVRADATLLVFDKIVGSGFLGTGAASLESLFSLHEAALVRFDVERVRRPGSKGLAEVRISRLGEYAPQTPALVVAFGPVSGQPEMLRVIPKQPLVDGLYALRVKDQYHYFLVGLEPTELYDHQANRCQDKHSDSRSKSSGFSWEDWMSAASGGGESRAGNWLERVGFLPCEVLDAEAEAWRKSATDALRAGDPERAFSPSRLYKAFNPSEGADLEREVLAALRSAATESSQRNEWQSAQKLASLALEIEPSDVEMQRVSKEAEAENARAAAVRRAAAEERYAAHLKASYSATEVLGRFAVVSGVISSEHGFKEGDRHVVEITDVSVRGLAFFENARMINSTNRLEDEYWFCNVMREPVRAGKVRRSEYQVVVQLRHLWRWYAVLESAEEQARFVETLNSAKESWYRQYGDLVVEGRCPKR